MTIHCASYERRKALIEESQKRLSKAGMTLVMDGGSEPAAGTKVMKGVVRVPTTHGEIMWSFTAGKLSGETTVLDQDMLLCLVPLVSESLDKLGRVSCFHPRGSTFQAMGYPVRTTDYIEVPLAVNDAGVAVVCLELKEELFDIAKARAIEASRTQPLPNAVKRLLDQMKIQDSTALFFYNAFYIFAAIRHHLSGGKLGDSLAGRHFNMDELVLSNPEWDSVYDYIFSRKKEERIKIQEIALYTETITD